VVYRKGELSRATMDREWPHQIALSPEYLRGKNCIIVQRFCRGLSVCPRNRSYWRDRKEYIAIALPRARTPSSSRCTSAVSSLIRAISVRGRG
jgi:hypothetical protein